MAELLHDLHGRRLYLTAAGQRAAFLAAARKAALKVRTLCAVRPGTGVGALRRGAPLSRYRRRLQRAGPA